jgi:AAA ATPase domain
VAAEFFINRDEELQRFQAITSAPGKPVLVVCGEDGVGKSALRRRMEAECAARKVLVEWRKTRPYDHVGIMVCVAEAAAAAFGEFQALLDRFEEADRSITVNLQTAGAIEIARDAHLQNVGSVKAAAVNIEQLVAGPRSNGLAANRMTRLTTAFLRCLADSTAEGPLVIFLDAFEMADMGTKDWLWNEFAAVLDDSSLQRIRLVIFTSEMPAIESSLRRRVDILPLAPLKTNHIVDYMQRRGVSLPGDLFGVVADGVIAATSGNMIGIVTAVEAMLARQQTAAGQK